MVLRRFPRIFKAKTGRLYLIYSNRVEEYLPDKKYTKSDMEKMNPNAEFLFENIYGKGWNPAHEIQVLEENGIQEVHVVDEDDIHRQMDNMR